MDKWDWGMKHLHRLMVTSHRLVTVCLGFEFVCATTHMEPGISQQLKRGLATIRLEFP